MPSVATKLWVREILTLHIKTAHDKIKEISISERSLPKSRTMLEINATVKQTFTKHIREVHAKM